MAQRKNGNQVQGTEVANETTQSNEVNGMAELKAAIDGKKLKGATPEERKIQALQKVEAQKATAIELIEQMNVEDLTKKELTSLFKVHKVVICLEKSGAHYNYKGSDLNFYVKSANNVVAYFEGATAEGLAKLQQIAKEVKGSPKYLRIINGANGKSANLGSVAKFKGISDVFAQLSTIKNLDINKLIVIPSNTKVALVMEQFMISRERGLKALEIELSAKEQKAE